MVTFRWHPLQFCFLFAGLIVSHAPAQAANLALPRSIDFNRDIRPILSENCYFCHGPDRNKRKADLRLDTHDGLFSIVKGHSTVVAGRPEQSELFQLVVDPDPDQRMPDPKSNKRLSDRQIVLLKEWIEQGAPWKGFWAYLPPTRPPMPPNSDPAFVHNPIDRFVLTEMEQGGLGHAREANRVTLIRRLSFDLRGLPPTEAEVAQFVGDASPDAYEKVVDRFLADPHFGERMAVWWLDLVRFADTIGYHSDNPMNIWPYRDYVIRAFNDDKPFDQFTREQLAGDLLPDSSQEQKVASAYNRLLETTEEGGAQAKEYAVKYECDRVRNISTVWLAATMGCSQCHDHKFDPYTQKDFYSMAAFFADVQEAAIGAREPGMAVLSASQIVAQKRLDAEIASLQRQLDAPTPQLAAEQAEWVKQLQSASKTQWTILEPATLKSQNGSQLKKLPDGSVIGSKFAPTDTFVVSAFVDLEAISGIRLEAIPDSSLAAQGPGASSNGNFVLTGFDITAKDGHPLKLARVAADHSQDGYPVGNLLNGNATGWAVLPQIGKEHHAIFELAEPLHLDGPAQLVFSLKFQSPFGQHEIGRFRLSVTGDAMPAAREAVPANIRQIVAKDPEQWSQSEQKEVTAFYRTIAPMLQPMRDRLAKATKERADLEAGAPRCLVSTSGPPRVTRLLHRGNWQDDTGPIELPAVPAFLPQSAVKKDRLTRLDLANWLVCSKNPLTARVVVNRLWKMFMGTGISKTLDDLGSQGESPTDPELLDWLAVEFQNPTSGSAHPWDMKHIIRLIVTSGAYRQGSLASPLDEKLDPFNRLYAHQSRFRLDAETIRDNALDVSGLLSDKMYGPSVKPYQPAGYWDALNFPVRTYEPDKGGNEYRRGVYSWWQRSFPNPSLLAFDAPTREEGTCERMQSNIPQQALVLLDDPTYVEAARVLAARVLRQGGSNLSERLDWVYEQVLNRPPRPQEVQVLRQLLFKHLREYEQDKESAAKLIATGDSPVPKDLNAADLAAWTSVSRVILNLSETITRS